VTAMAHKRLTILQGNWLFFLRRGFAVEEMKNPARFITSMMSMAGDCPLACAMTQELDGQPYNSILVSNTVLQDGRGSVRIKRSNIE
jgi:hypothetical protein